MKEEKIKVLAVLPMELPKEIELDNTLEAMQKFVGGLEELIPSWYELFCLILYPGLAAAALDWAIAVGKKLRKK